MSSVPSIHIVGTGLQSAVDRTKSVLFFVTKDTRRPQSRPLSVAHHPPHADTGRPQHPRKEEWGPRKLVKLVALSASGVALASCVNGLFVAGSAAVRGLRAGGNGGSSGGGGNGGGDGGGNWWSIGGTAMALEEIDEEEEEDEEETTSAGADSKARPDVEEFDAHGMRVGQRMSIKNLNPNKRYKVTSLDLIDSSTEEAVEKDDPFWEMLANISKGGVFKKADLDAELQNLVGCGLFQQVGMEAVAQENGTVKIEVKFDESSWPPASRIRCVNVGLMLPDVPKPGELNPDQEQEVYKKKLRNARECLLPASVEHSISRWLSRESRLTARMLQRIRDDIQKWYIDQGYVCAMVVNYGNLNSDEIVCEVVEGDITGVDVMFNDKINERTEGATDLRIIKRELPLELSRGHVYNINAGRKALSSLNALGLIANIEVVPRPDDDMEGGIVVEVKLREMDPKQMDLSMEWSVAPGDTGKPTLVNLVPGGTVTVEHRNLSGLNRNVYATLSTQNLLNPQDELDFKVEYVHPTWDGLDDPRNRVLRASWFNNRKLSATFVGGPTADEVPIVWVDRAGLKVGMTESFPLQSKLTYSAVIEEVATRDENQGLINSGVRVLPTGMLADDGPPTTLSPGGKDTIAFLQGNVTRDMTTFVNGTTVGDRTIFEVNQGVGVGSKKPFFNRHSFSFTRFHQLSKESATDKDVPPWVGVMHARYAGCFGDLPSYEAFSLGGPYSVRGYSMGELGAARRVLELAGELRIPVKNTHAYGFVDYGTDLGSSEAVKGDPTHFFARAGSGASVGLGVKLGPVRSEYVLDCNRGAWNFMMRYGERF